MKILGLSAHYHDSAAALVVDGVPVRVVQEERLSREKNDASFPLAAIEWCLESEGLRPEDLDAVVFYEKPMRKFERILTTALEAFPRSWSAFPKAMKNALGEKLWVKGLIQSYLGLPARKVLFSEHHLSHAAASFFTSPTRRAAILTADGVGEWATLSVARGEKRDDGSCSLEVLREIHFPHSLGMLYSTFTAFLGFAVNEGEYKVMGLASYGTPRFADEVRRIVHPTPNGGFALDMGYFDYHTTSRRSFSPLFVDRFGAPRGPREPIDLATPEGRRYADLAASVQLVLEETLVGIARAVREETGLDDLCLGGGVALNGCANARILREAGFERVFVPPAPGDAGCAVGAALYADRVHFGRPDRAMPDHAFWGPVARAEDLMPLALEDGFSLDVEATDAALFTRLTGAIADGAIVGWMDGACELGPRALGHRSILAAPHDTAIRDRLNKDVKYREEFRPFAPVVTEEDAERFFELPPGGARLARFMSGVFPVRAEHRDRLAAVTHVDGTARVQVVDRGARLHALLRAYGERTGIPVLLNTSFNLAGEPIVTSAVEGYVTFRRCGMDLLVVGRHVMAKARARSRDADEDLKEEAAQ